VISGAREAAGGLGAVRRGRGGGQPGGPGRLSIPAGPPTQRWARLQRRGGIAPFQVPYPPPALLSRESGVNGLVVVFV